MSQRRTNASFAEAVLQTSTKPKAHGNKANGISADQKSSTQSVDAVKTSKNGPRPSTSRGESTTAQDTFGISTSNMKILSKKDKDKLNPPMPSQLSLKKDESEITTATQKQGKDDLKASAGREKKVPMTPKLENYISEINWTTTPAKKLSQRERKALDAAATPKSAYRVGTTEDFTTPSRDVKKSASSTPAFLSFSSPLVNKKSMKPDNPPRRQRTKKRFSAMKKRILLARLKAHMESKNKKPENNLKSKDSVENVDNNVLGLLNFVELSDVQDAEERDEVVENVRVLCNPFGPIERIVICSPITDDTEPTCTIAVVFQSSGDASASSEALTGLIIAGTSIETFTMRDADLNNMRQLNTYPCRGNTEEQGPSLSNPTSNVIDIEGTGSSQTNALSPFAAVLRVRNLIWSEDIADEEEAEEVLHDLKTLCEPYGEISKVWIETETANLKEQYDLSLDAYIRRSSLCTCVIVRYQSSLSCLRIAERIHGIPIAGEELSSSLILPSLELNNSSISWQHLPVIGSYAIEYDSDVSKLREYLASMRYNPQINEVSVMTIDGPKRGIAATSLCAIIAIIEWLKSDINTTIYQLSSSLNESMSSDKMLSAGYESKYQFALLQNSYLIVQGYANDEDILEASNEELIEMKKDFLSIISDQEKDYPSQLTLVHSKGVDVTSRTISIADSDGTSEYSSCIGCVGYKDSASAVSAMIAIDGTIIGGKNISANVQYFDTSDISSTAITMKQLESDTKPSETSNVSQVATSSDIEDASAMKYSAALGLSHLPKHDNPSLADVPVANDEINESVFALLDLLATFQQRMKERDPLKYKLKLRFVTGMKQVINAIKAGKVRLILLAPDTEINGEIDSKLKEMKEVAIASEVPILYSLNRRKLAKACHLSMRQSVVGVYDPDGAYDHFKKIIRYILPKDF